MPCSCRAKRKKKNCKSVSRATLKVSRYKDDIHCVMRVPAHLTEVR
jgi:hypothetical protein